MYIGFFPAKSQNRCPCIIAVLIAIEFYHHFISQFIWSAIPEFFTSVEVGSTSIVRKYEIRLYEL
jgi:hypothetical protein